MYCFVPDLFRASRFEKVEDKVEGTDVISVVSRFFFNHYEVAQYTYCRFLYFDNVAIEKMTNNVESLVIQN